MGIDDSKAVARDSSVFSHPPRSWLNLLEPPALVASFLRHPPAGFTPLTLGPAAAPFPAFVTPFDLLTTLEDPYRRYLRRIPGLNRALCPPTLFVGTTVSEYCLYPLITLPDELLATAREQLAGHDTSVLIIKDIPEDSPLLSEIENAAATTLIAACRKAGWLVVAGQALAYVPIDFAHPDELLKRLSYSRRKSIRRKLRAGAKLTITTHLSGDPWFDDPAVLAELYTLYLNVYRQSDLHFDLLSAAFFQALLQGRDHRGVVFVYRHQGRLIGYNLCFIHNDNLVDKYVGFDYPAAREHNLYYVSWFHNLEFAIDQGLKHYVAGWTDPEIKAFLGARFTLTRHAVHLRNPWLRTILKHFQRFFEPDRRWAELAPPEDST